MARAQPEFVFSEDMMLWKGKTTLLGFRRNRKDTQSAEPLVALWRAWVGEAGNCGKQTQFPLFPLSPLQSGASQLEATPYKTLELIPPSPMGKTCPGPGGEGGLADRREIAHLGPLKSTPEKGLRT